MIKKYFKKLEESLDDYNHIIEDQIINKQTFTDEKGSVEGEVFFIDETCLDFLEVVNTTKNGKEKYKYHYMDKENDLIFRYDNAPHHKDLKNFPHHKHTENGVEETEEPDLKKILNEVENKLINK